MSASDPQWRKIVYGEPLFPKMLSNAKPAAEAVSPTTTSAEQLAKIIHGDPLYPTLRTPSPSLSDSGSEDDSELSSPSNQESPSADSIFYPPTNSAAPSHTYLDPSYYDTNIPPVPPIPAQYQAGSSNSGSMPTSPSGLQRRRELPIPPVLPQAISPPWPRSRSTPPDESLLPSSSGARDMQTFYNSAHSRSSSVVSTSGSFSSRRQLPLPPPQNGPPSQPLPIPREKQALQFSPRSLPPTPAPRGGINSSTQNDAHAQRRPTLKEADNLAAWMRALTRQPVTGLRESIYDLPPPAYESINFSHPAQGQLSHRP